MLSHLHPSQNRAIGELISHLVNSATKLPRAVRSSILTRYDHIYGDLQGQRALKLSDISKYTYSNTPPGSYYDSIIALESYFALLCNLISASALTGNPTKFLKSSQDMNDKRLRETLVSIATGKFHVANGITHYDDMFEINCLHGELPQPFLASARELLAAV